MTPELEEKLMAAYPQLFRGKDMPVTENLMAFGCEHNDGWFAIIKARELIQSGTRVTPYLNNRWATRAQMEQRNSINLDDAFNEQWSEIYG